MKATTMLPLLLFAFLIDFAHAQDDALDKEITQFAEQIATQVQKAGIKKVAVLDLTDLQGNITELGKFIAEQATVDLVSTSRSFSVVDRTHLNSILAEHKLTISGLVQPENAKKLGQFSGVDAIVLGTLTPLSETIKITAKIISTETADVLGAAKGQITKSAGVGKLLGNASEQTKNTLANPNSDPVAATPVTPIERNTQRIDDLLVKVESMKYTTDGVHGFVRVTMILQNTSPSKTLGVELYSRSNAFANSQLVNDRGDEFILRGPDVAGIPMASHPHYFADIQPGARIVASLKYSLRWQDRERKPGNWGPYRLQAEIMFGVEDKGQYTDVKTPNVVIDAGRAQ